MKCIGGYTMEMIFDFHPEDSSNFKKDCKFFMQHYIFMAEKGSFEEIPFGHCSIKNKQKCKDCKYYFLESKESKAEMYSNQRAILKNLEEHLKWMENFIKNFCKDEGE